jgi:hypothetical protein
MRRLAILSLVLGLGTTACSSDTPVTPETPPVLTTDVFDSTTDPPKPLTPNGAVTWSFQSASAGAVQASLTSLTPDSTAVVGLALGTWNGTACQLVIANDQATQGTLITGNVSTSGALCVRIYDPAGVVTEPLNYTISVAHY